MNIQSETVFSLSTMGAFVEVTVTHPAEANDVLSDVPTVFLQQGDDCIAMELADFIRLTRAVSRCEHNKS